MKNIKLLAALAIVSFAMLTGCLKDDFKEVVGVCPVVLSTNPGNLVNGVLLNQVVTVTFNEEMNPKTITPDTFTLTGPEASVVGIVSFSGKTASLTPFSPLLPDTTYTARVTTAVKDLQGNALQVDYVWTFHT